MSQMFASIQVFVCARAFVCTYTFVSALTDLMQLMTTCMTQPNSLFHSHFWKKKSCVQLQFSCLVLYSTSVALKLLFPSFAEKISYLNTHWEGSGIVCVTGPVDKVENIVHAWQIVSWELSVSLGASKIQVLFTWCFVSAYLVEFWNELRQF